MSFKVTTLSFTAAETVRGQDAAGNDIADEQRYTFRGYEFPGGVVMIPSSSSADEFYCDRDAVQAHGKAQVVGVVEVLGEEREFDADEVRAAVEASAREYGKGAIPAAMVDWLSPAAEHTLPDGQNLQSTEIQARRVWQVWRALAPVATISASPI